MTRLAVIFIGALFPLLAQSQGGDQQLRTKADALFEEQRFAEAYPLYSQLVSLTPGDRQLNYRFGTCSLFGNEDKEKAIGHLKYATEDPAIPAQAWYWLGRAYHLNYRFKEAQQAYQRFLGTGDKKAITAWPVEALDAQCRNGEKLLSNLKEITVRSKMEVEDAEFFRFYDLSDIGGKIVVLPDELKTSIDKKKKERSLIYLPGRGGPIYFSSYGKDGTTGRDIYRTELLPDGTFATPVKLAGYINTDQDEDFAFMHPDGRTFYFSSKGHNSMGGYDVFRTTYDRGLDAFGRPENMDFAVNTPDDDIFYMVDGEQKEACFASGRNSRQGKLHVYRVATTQQQLIISVFKGTYASAFDEKDRGAHIMVEDDVTRERVADVRTDMNGNYVLSVPRGGRFRYKVECGPSGKTHTGVVDVPKNDGPRAYRQELVLERNGDLEQLAIRNYFDEPLGDDIIALALDEIKRRARLDVSTHEPVAQVEEEKPVGDLMTRAGFTGDIDQAGAIALAKEDAADQEAEAMDLEAQSREAYAIAVEASAEAERTAEHAATLVEQAATTAEPERNDMMVEAARERQRSREANLRARAAFRTGEDMNAAALTKRQNAATASKRSTELAAAIAAKNEAAALPLLVAVKERQDEKSGPNMEQDAAEKARRAVTEHEKTVERAMQVAKAKRAEENELTDRVARLKREQDGTRARGRKEELGREIAGYEEQLVYLRKETQAEFNKVTALEKQTAALRGQASLTRHLVTGGAQGPGTELSNDQASQLALRIADIDTRIAEIPIDERYEAQLITTPAEVEARTFDWDLASAARGSGTDRSDTRTVDRSTTQDAQRASGRTTQAQGSAVVGGTTGTATIGSVPSTSGEEEPGTTTIQVVSGNSAERGSTTQEIVPSTSGEEEPIAPSAQVATGNSAERANGTQQRVPEGSDVAAAQQTTTTTAQRSTEPADPSTANTTDRFLLENERAELVQLAQAERDRTRKDSLQARMTAIDQQLIVLDAATTEAAQQPAEEELDSEGVDMDRPIITFTEATKDGTIVSQLYSDYTADKQRVASITDADERASGINGLELMLADSLRDEMARQVALLELAPEQADVVLPRVARLRQLRDAHIAEGEQALTQRREELAALSPSTVAMGGANNTARVATEGRTSTSTLDDRFIVIDRYAENVYASRIEHRSTADGMTEAVALRDADVARIDDLSIRIDSMETVLSGMGASKESDRLRKKTVLLIDERLITRTDMGQRTAFITKEEWRTATDSIKGLERAVEQRSLAPDEPLVMMAQGMEADAKRAFEQGAQLRKRADRSEDIMLRDSLYRHAYMTELEALREMDRAITMKNYLVSTEHQRGEAITYEQVAARVLGVPESASTEPLLAGATPKSTTQETTTSEPVVTGVDPTRTETTQDAGSTESTVTQPPVSETTAERDVEAPVVVVPVPASTTTTTSDRAPTEVAATQSVPAVEAPATVTPASTRNIEELIAAQIAKAESGLRPQDRMPVQLYESFLASEGAVLTETLQEPVVEPQLLDMRAKRAAADAASMQQHSMELADKATLLADSAANAKKRDRERLELLATRTRATSDSLHTASLAKADEARIAATQQQEAEQAKLYRERLVKYYYLTPEERDLVTANEDHSRYFQAKARALEQYEAAASAQDAAQSNRAVGRVLAEQARATERDATAGRIPAAEAAERARLLDARSILLLEHADSLDNVAARLRGAANINESQASVMLQALPGDRSSELMALEMRTRRTETLLAEGHDQAGRPRDVVPAASTTSNDGLGRDTETATSIPVRSGTERTNAEPVRIQPAAATVAPFTMPVELSNDIFELRASEERTEVPVPLDAAMPTGIVFKVQIGAFRKPVPEATFSDMTPVMGETVGNGLVRYTAGLFTGFEHAAAAKELVRDRGYRDAFVVAYRDGKRIPLGEAMRAERTSTIAAAQPTSGRPVAGSTQPATRTTTQPVAPATTAEQPVATIQPAVTTLVPPAQQDIAVVLATYPATAEEVVARFAPAPDAAAYYNVPGAAPARQVETIKGLFFTVQVGVYSKPVPLEKLFNITPLNSERTETAKVRYTTGLFLDTELARIRKDETVTLGVKDAFVTAYLNGKRIPMREATALLEKFGPAILAKP